MFPPEVQSYIPLLIPLVLIQFGLMITALLDLLRREHTNGQKWVWLLVILLVNFIGPIVYFLLGRKENDLD